jgi:hypothetical protein
MFGRLFAARQRFDSLLDGVVAATGPLQGNVSLNGSIIAPNSQHLAHQDLPQPTEQFGLRCALKLYKASLGFDKGLLHKVGRADLPLQIPAQLMIRHQQQVITAGCQQFSHGSWRAISRIGD